MWLLLIYPQNAIDLRSLRFVRLMILFSKDVRSLVEFALVVIIWNIVKKTTDKKWRPDIDILIFRYKISICNDNSCTNNYRTNNYCANNYCTDDYCTNNYCTNYRDNNRTRFYFIGFLPWIENQSYTLKKFFDYISSTVFH